MTIPVERTRAVMNAGRFLLSLLDPKKTPKVPRAIRHEAGAVLRHYPASFEMRRTHNRFPDLWGPIE